MYILWFDNQNNYYNAIELFLIFRTLHGFKKSGKIYNFFKDEHNNYHVLWVTNLLRSAEKEYIKITWGYHCTQITDIKMNQTNLLFDEITVTVLFRKILGNLNNICNVPIIEN